MTHGQRIRRIFWSSSDQALSSVSNLLLSILVARLSPQAEFGAFAIAFAIYQFALGMSRALSGEPILIRVTPEEDTRKSASVAVSSGLLLGITGLLVCAVLGLTIRDHANIFFAMAVAFPLLMLTDAARYWEYSHERARSAFTIDMLWLITQLLSFALLAVVGLASATTVVLTWGFGALAGLLYFSARRGAPLAPVEGAHWLGKNRDLSLRFAAEYLAISGVQQSVIIFSVIFAGLTASASIRGGQVILGPLSILSMGLAVVALPALSKVARGGPQALRQMLRRSVALSFALSTATICYGLGAMLIPAELGQAILGDSWLAGFELLPLLALQMLASNVAYGATSGMRALQLSRLSLRLRWTTAPAVVLLVIAGAWLYGAPGAVAGAAIGGLTQSILWWAFYYRYIRVNHSS